MRLKLLIMAVITRMKFRLYENVSCPLNLQPWNRPIKQKILNKMFLVNAKINFD